MLGFKDRGQPELFEAVLTRSVEACVAAGIARGEVVHVDASLIRADVTWDAIADAHAEAVVKAHPDLPDAAPVGPAPTADKPPPGHKPRRVCTTDPDASLGKVRRNLPAQPCYKQHTAVDQERGVVLDIVVTTGAAHESTLVEGQLDTVAATTGRPIGIATLDAGYAVTRIFAALEARGIEAVVPTRPERPPKRGVIPVRRFKLDAPQPRALSARTHPAAPWQAGRRRLPGLPGYGQGLLGLPLADALLQPDHEETRHPAAQGPSRPDQGPAQAPRLGSPREGDLRFPSRAGRRRARRGQDLARPRPSGPTRDRQHADPGLPHGHGDQPQAARRRSAAPDQHRPA